MKFSGTIGFWKKDVETKPGVYKSQIIEKRYVGDILSNSRRFQSSENQQTEDLRVTSRISIMSDLYMRQNWGSVKYVFWNGMNWSVSSVDITPYPRIILELGGIYNGKTGAT